MKSGLPGTGLAVPATTLPSAGSAQAPAPCAPAQTASVEITTREVRRATGYHDIITDCRLSAVKNFPR